MTAPGSLGCLQDAITQPLTQGSIELVPQNPLRRLLQEFLLESLEQVPTHQQLGKLQPYQNPTSELNGFSGQWVTPKQPRPPESLTIEWMIAV